MNSAEVSRASEEKPPSPAVFAVVLLIVGAIGFSPWVVAKYAKETPASEKRFNSLRGAFQQSTRFSTTHPGTAFSPRAQVALQYEHDRKFEEAIGQFTSLIDSNTANRALNYLARGRCYLGLNRFAEAVSDFNNSLAINPYDGDAYLERAAAYHRMGQEEKCAQDLMQARKYRK